MFLTWDAARTDPQMHHIRTNPIQANRQTSLLFKLAPSGLRRALAVLDPTARREPDSKPIGGVDPVQQQEAGLAIDYERTGRRVDRRLLDVGQHLRQLHVGKQALEPAFAAEARLFVAAERRGWVEAVVRVRPDHTGAHPLGHPEDARPLVGP